MQQFAFTFDLPEASGDDPVLTSVRGLQQQIAALADVVQTLAAAQEQLKAQQAAAGRRGGLSPTVFRWTDLTRKQASDSWALLINWVQWLVTRYRCHDDLPACWSHHGAFVEELSALCLSWYGAYTKAAHPDEALNWHEALARARTRWQDWDDTKCRSNPAHTDPQPPHPHWQTARDEAFDIAQADVITRPARTARRRGGNATAGAEA